MNTQSKLQHNHTESGLREKSDFHGRPYRRYTDGTLKAATSSGWKEFPDFDALCEYHWKRHFAKKQEKQQKKEGFLKRLFPRRQ